MTLPSIAVIGTGAVARAILHSHRSAGGAVVAVVSRDAGRARRMVRAGEAATTDVARAGAADVVLVAVSDGAVAEVGARLAAIQPVPSAVFLHTSGALSGADLGERPLRTGSLHPLQSFPRPAADVAAAAADALLGTRVPGTHWFHEGEGASAAAALVGFWRGHFHALAPGSKALYHAGAAILSNHTVALFDAATRLFEAAGVAPSASRAPLATLLDGTAGNVAALGAVGALTGPVSRGDLVTVRAHVDALRATAPDLVASYVELGRLAVDVAVRKGTIDAERAARLMAVLTS